MNPETWRRLNAEVERRVRCSTLADARAAVVLKLVASRPAGVRLDLLRELAELIPDQFEATVDRLVAEGRAALVVDWDYDAGGPATVLRHTLASPGLRAVTA